MKRLSTLTISILVVCLIFTANTPRVNSSERPEWIPSDWIQLTISPYDDVDPSWSPDGSRIVYRHMDANNWDRDIWLMNADGSDKTQLTDLGVSQNPHISPDGSKILFEQYVGLWFHIAVVDYDGTNLQYLYTTGTCRLPSWSPSGEKIAFARSSESTPDPPWHTYTINADGSNPVQLTSEGHSDAPVWSPDGSKIVFQSYRGGQYDVYVMDSDGSNEIRLTDFGTSTTGSAPQWSPDGKKISFRREIDGHVNLYMMDPNGANVVALTDVPGLIYSHEWSPDGQWIALAINDQESDCDIYLMPAPVTEPLPALVDIDPDTLNLESNGQWITSYVTLPEGYSVEDVDVGTVELAHTDFALSADWAEVQANVLMVKFNRAEVLHWLGTVDYGEDTGKSVEVTLTVTGQVMGVEPAPFEGSDTVNVLLKG